jgi:restriction system protein
MDLFLAVMCEDSRRIGVQWEKEKQMALPTHQEAMQPILDALKDGKPRHVGDLTVLVGDAFNLSPTERAQRIPSERLTVISSRCHWAIFYMSQAKLISRVARGTYAISDRGLDLLKAGGKIDTKRPRSFPEFVAFQNRKKGDVASEANEEHATISISIEQTPDDMIHSGYQIIRSALKEELLSRISTKSPSFFERMVVDLLLAMGYGGAFGEAIQALGQSGDGGIDGIIKEDKLGLDFVYVQAKHCSAPAGSAICGQSHGKECIERRLYYDIVVFDRCARLCQEYCYENRSR